jgi:anthranilate synthase/aminodeoxychorismate synthase-like glutamine amidotransferase
MLLIIDNYDSFTYNLVQYFGEMGAVMEIRRNDQITLEEIEKLKPDHICISPGPCTPKEAGISCAVIERFGKPRRCSVSASAIRPSAMCFGGDVVRAGRLMHGKTSMIHHSGQSVFKGLPEPFEATRYHSLHRQTRHPAGLPRDHRHRQRRRVRDHGPAAQRTAHPRRPVPPGVHPHAGRQAPAEELPGDVGGGPSLRPLKSLNDLVRDDLQALSDDVFRL